MTLRTGITTGTCAAAAAKAAAGLLADPAATAPESVRVMLPGGDAVEVAIEWARREAGAAAAAVRKDAGDDPDVTHGMRVVVKVQPTAEGDATCAGVTFAAGEGVGVVTRPGLQVAPGEPAINPGPRRMIERAIHDVLNAPVRVEVSMPGGAEVAARTFNPRLGIVGGLSILGTTGIVRPYCQRAMHDALSCALGVAAAAGVVAPVLAPGNIGATAVARHFVLADPQTVEVGNEWAFVLDALERYPFKAVLLGGHPGKLAKLAAGQWDTHSSRSQSPTRIVGPLFDRALGRPAPDTPTVEGLFAALDGADRARLADALAAAVAEAVSQRLRGRIAVAVLLVNMAGDWLGAHGEFSPWQKRTL